MSIKRWKLGNDVVVLALFSEKSKLVEAYASNKLKIMFPYFVNSEIYRGSKTIDVLASEFKLDKIDPNTLQFMEGQSLITTCFER